MDGYQSIGGDTDTKPNKEAVRRLETEVRIHSILNGMSSPRVIVSNGSPPVANVPLNNDQSIVSHLTETEERNVSSSVGGFASNIVSTVSKAFSLLPPAKADDSSNSSSRNNNNGGDIGASEEHHVTFTESKPSKIDFLKDDLSQMTWGRRIGLANARKKWYNPSGVRAKLEMEETESPPEIETRPPKITRKDIPSLETAWAYFEHSTLSRFMVKDDGTYDKHDLKRAEPGECDRPTQLYHPITTPMSQMGDFGLGIGLYFSTLRSIAVLTLIAGLINIPNIVYFSGTEYSLGQYSAKSVLIKGSAVCTNEQWVPCPNCTESNFLEERFAISEKLVDGEYLTFALRNFCDAATMMTGMVNYGTVWFIILGILVLNLYLLRKEVEFDEDEQTSQDYSIRITNPPVDARDPDEWRKYFKDVFGAHSTVVTVALDNDPLVRALKERRECMRKIEINLEPGTPLDILTLSKMAAEVEMSRTLFGKILALISPGMPELFGRVAELEAKIRGWAQLDYDCSNVFVTFETEKEQREVLSALSVGSYHVKRQNIEKCRESKHLFRDKLMLQVKEPQEPNTIRWADLNLKKMDILKPMATTTICSAILIFLIALLIRTINDWKQTYAALAIAAANVTFPQVAKILTSFERHSSMTGIEISLYFKIAVFRWITSAIVMTIITPFARTVNGDGLIYSIYLIFFTEIVTTNAIQLIDIPGLLQRHFLAPRAVTQDAMNRNMLGSTISLAERYTNMTKILFLALWYCSIYPAALFMCSFALFINYYTDRFSLMRTWKRFPHLGTGISTFSRIYFFTGAIVAMSIISAYYWSGFPYDNLCDNGPDNLPDPYKDFTGNIISENESKHEYVAGEDASSFRYCRQDLLNSGRTVNGKIPFPALSIWQAEGDEWMTDSQEEVVNIQGWTSVGIMCLAISFFVVYFLEKVKKMFQNSHKPCGEDQGINFGDVDSKAAYVPQVYSNVFSFPLLACDASSLDAEAFDWTDPNRPHGYYDLTKDAAELITEDSTRHEHVFSKISYVPACLSSSQTK
mmetsp:Transcript_24108/g.35726  ORF Transcript_24108/g.35726 Transcript_24108/m.35726 type:complete len:1034 (-) Transcript_24108:246-3347(-)|eukprot:CAMPEP_0194228140 /NCGR_PEP_ID=MMETSP0156-20130528/43221_1 /TAXON_ID=33649 /ORGANISM="Thalassionema nitzschioides, Strain L26-B" /LENGTH=1033 /DNA_ID=CAMNT_0038960647 /DNA_START=54 /DNA_END=3155 /DNA_ORIENTATION=-